MKTMKKRALSLLLAVMMVVSVLPVSAFAALGDSAEEPYVIETATGSISGAALFTYLKDTLKLEEGSYSLFGSLNYIGYWVDGKQIKDDSATVSGGPYLVYKAKSSWGQIKQGDSLGVWISIQKAATADLTLKDGPYAVTVGPDYSGLAEKIIEAAVATSTGDVTVQFHDKYTSPIYIGSRDQYLDLSEDDLSTYLESEDKTSFRLICGNTTEDITVTVTAQLPISLKSGVAGNTVEVPVNFFYGVSDVEQNFLANVVAATCDTDEDYNDSEVKLEVKEVIWLDYATALATAATFNAYNTPSAKLSYNGTELGEFTLKFTETRGSVTLTTSDTSLTIEAKAEPDDLLEQIKALVSVETADVSINDCKVMWRGTGLDLTYSEDYTWPADGASTTYYVVVRYEENEDYVQSDSSVITVTLTDTTVSYTVTYDFNGGEDAEGNTQLSKTLAEDSETPDAPEVSRENYTFTGWDKKIADTVTENVTYTATWQINNDNNKNDIPDEIEAYTVIFDYNDGVDAEGNIKQESTMAWNAPITAPEVTRDGYQFAGWSPVVATNVTAPAEGTTITYTAQWTLNHAVIFMNNGVQHDTAEVVDGENVTEPNDPTWDEDHDFLGWYNGDMKYDFGAPVTESLTLTAKWMNDFNHNDIDDETEIHVDIQYLDGENPLATFEKVLVGLDTPTITDPTKNGYKFEGWAPEVAEKVVAPEPVDGVYGIAYLAQWSADINGNGVNDAAETITITVNTAVEGDTITVTGAVAAENSYVYDSTSSDNVTIKASPVDTSDGTGSYVASITVNGEAVDLTYDKNYAATCGFAPENGAEVVVTFAEAKFVYNEDAVLDYYPGKQGVTNADVYNAKVQSPELPGDFTLKYLAREEASAEVTLTGRGLGELIDGLLKTVGYDTITIELDELWLDVNVEDMSGLIEDSVDLNTAIDQNLNDETFANLMKIYNDNNTGGLLGPANAIGKVVDELKSIITDITKAATYYGAHNFGYNATDAETVEEIIKITYQCEAFYIEDQTTIALLDMRLPSYINTNSETNAFSVMYKDYTDEELAELIGAVAVDADGYKLEGDVTCITLTQSTFEGSGATDNAYELTFKFPGNETHKPSEAVIAVTVTKAPVKYDAPNVNVTYGEKYEVMSAENFTLGNKYGEYSEVADSMIQFVIGLDVADFAVDAEGNVTGLNGKIQIILPDELKNILDMIQSATGGNVEDGIEMSIGDLLKYLSMIPDTSIDALDQILDAIAGISELGELKITLGGALPGEVGAYLYGAVSTSSNYETAFDVSYILIKPIASRVYLDWNYTDTNGIFTYDLIRAVDMGASAYDDAAFNIKNETATGKINNLIFGVIPGIDPETNEPTAELKLTMYDAYGHNTDKIEEDLPLGAYTQLAFIGDFGNSFYYAVPIVRPVIITPNLVEVKFDDANDNNAFLFTFDGEPQEVTASVYVGGEKINFNEEDLTITYYGVRTTGETYNSATAPIHAGAYTAVATYIAHDAEDELETVGAAVAAIVIQPAEAQIAVDNQVITWDGKAHDVESLITVIDQVENDDAKYTVITAQVNSEGDVSENGLAGVRGKVNVDFPAALDAILRERNVLSKGYTDEGINASVVIEALKNVSFLGDETVDQMVAILEQLPEDAKLTFYDDVKVSSVGVYLVLGIITDPDYMPEVGAGVLVIAPETVEGILKFNYEDSNNIFTQALLADMKANGLDLNASAFDKAGEKSEEITALVKNLFVGTDAKGNVVVTDDWTKLTNGIYTEVSFVEINVGSVVYYAKPITRTITIVPSAAVVKLVDANNNNAFLFTYDGQPKAVAATVAINDKPVTPVDGELTIRYIGVTAKGEAYDSTTAPVEIGAYTIVATYVKYNEDGSLYAAGGTVGAMVIAHPCINGHTAEEIPAVAPTCTETGLTAGSKCSVCGKTLVEQEVVDALGHTEEIIPGKEATCTETGLTEGKKCSVCGETLVAQEVVDALGHNFDNDTYYHNDTHHWTKCSRCQIDSQKAWHDWDDGKVTVRPTTRHEGVMTYTCEVCDATYTEPIDRLHGSNTGSSAIVLKFDTNGGEKIDSIRCKRNEVVDLDDYVPTKDGFIFMGWYLDEDLTESVDSVKMTRSITVYARWFENTFVDVKENDWFFDAVIWGVDNGIMDPMDKTHFGPYDLCNRSLMITALWKAAGQPKASADVVNPFVDVTPEMECYEAVLWALENEITNGTSLTTFSPEAPVTRAQYVTFIFRYSEAEPVDIANPFVDVLNDWWYTDAILWAVYEEVTNGTSPTTFAPMAECNRAHIITFLYRYFA